MKKMTIKIYNITDISTLVAKAINIENKEVAIIQGRYVINGKSFMGVLSLDLTKEITVEYPADAYDFEDFIKNFKVE